MKNHAALPPALMALLDTVTDPIPQAVEKVRAELSWLHEVIAQLKSAEDKDGDCRSYLLYQVGELDDAVEALVEVIDSGRSA